MADLNFQKALDLLYAAVEAVTPRVLPVFGFKRYTGGVPLEECDDGIRWFQWFDSGDVLTEAPGDEVPKAGADFVWYRTDLELRILYPKHLLVKGDTTYRGLPGLRVADVIDLNKALMFSDPLAMLPADAEYMALQLRRSSLSGRIRSLLYRFSWLESLT
jgi:hypothetical protein